MAFEIELLETKFIAVQVDIAENMGVLIALKPPFCPVKIFDLLVVKQMPGLACVPPLRYLPLRERSEVHYLVSK